MALNRKIAYIDLSTGEVQTKPIPLNVRKKFLGGRGLDAYLLYNHTKKGCDPLGPDNALIISGGILTATCASATSRTHIMAKSPLTGMLGSANMGGFFAPELAWAGFHHLVIKGKAKNPSYIYIHNGEIEIRDARDIWGQSVTDSQWAATALRFLEPMTHPIPVRPAEFLTPVMILANRTRFSPAGPHTQLLTSSSPSSCLIAHWASVTD